MSGDLANASITFQPILKAIEEELYGVPSNGLKIRLIILLCLTGYYTILSAIFLGLVVEQARTSKAGLWVFRRVSFGITDPFPSNSQPRERTLIITNTKLVFSLVVFVQGLYIIYYLANGYNTYIHNNLGYSKAEIALRAFLPSPICVVGYILTFSLAQAFVLMHADQQRKIKWAPRLNRVFVWGAIIFGSGYLVTAIPSMYYGLRYWSNLRDFKTWLETQIGIGGLGPSLPQLTELNKCLDRHMHREGKYVIAARVQYASMPLLALFLLGVNMSTVFLSRIIKRSIDRQVATMSYYKAQNSIADAGVATLTRCHLPDVRAKFDVPIDHDSKVVNASSPIGGTPLENISLEPMHTFVSPLSQKLTFGVGSGVVPAPNAMTELESFGKPEEPPSSAEGVHRLQAVQLLELNATLDFCLYVGALIALCAIVASAVAIYVTASISANGPFFHVFGRTESVLYSFPWAMCILFCPALTLVVRVQFRTRSLWKVRKESHLLIHRQVSVAVDEA